MLTAPGADARGSPIALVSAATPNGQYIRTELEDAQGAFTLTVSATQNVVGPRAETADEPVRSASSIG